MNSTSEEEFSAVSQESWTTPMMKPMPTTCMAMSLGMPNRLHAMGISSREPPATPEEPQAAMEATTLSRKAVGKSTEMPRVLAAARVRTEMVMAAPAMLMVAPKGMETEYFSSSRPSSLHSRRLTGILAAELRVKKAMMPLSFRQRNTRG